MDASQFLPEHRLLRKTCLWINLIIATHARWCFRFRRLRVLQTGLNFIRNGCIVSLLALYGVVALAAFAVYRFDVFGWSAMVARR